MTVRSERLNLVMLDGLGVSDHIGMEHIGVGGFLHVLLALFEDALDASYR